MHPVLRTARTLVLAAAAACRLEYHPPPADTSLAEQSVDSVADVAGIETGEELTSFRRDRHFDFSGDGDPEEIKIRARGGRSDALTVTLRIEDPKDSVLYFDRWNSAEYLGRSNEKTRADRRAVRALVQGALERLVADSNFGAAVAVRLRATGGSENRHETVQRDVAEAIWRQRRSIPRDSAIVSPGSDSIEALVRVQPDRARVQRLLAEVRTSDRFFLYHRGGREAVALAWSPREHRFVRVWRCC